MKMQGYHVVETFRPVGGVETRRLVGQFSWFLFALLCKIKHELACDPAAGLTYTWSIHSGPTLREVRIGKSIGLREFAMRIGILPSIYCNIENGKDPASTVQQDAICRGLGLKTLPYIPPPAEDEGPLIPLFIRKVDGEPATEEDYRKMYEYLNDPDTKR